MPARHTDLYDAQGRLLLSTLDIDVEQFEELYPTWETAIVFERVTRETTTSRLEWNDLVAILERGQPVRYFR